MSLNAIIQQHGKQITLGKGEHVFNQGDEHQSLYFVNSGLLKAYYLSSEGKETIKSFLKPNNIIGSLNAAYEGKPCSFNLVTLEAATLTQFSFEILQQAASESHEHATQLINVLLSLSMKKEQPEYEFLMLPAEQRFLNFKNREPELYSKLTQNDVAKYLGITPVALSRIKNRQT